MNRSRVVRSVATAAAVVTLGGTAFVTATCSCPVPGFPSTAGTTVTTTTAGTTTTVVSGGCVAAFGPTPSADGCTAAMAGTDLEINVNSANSQFAGQSFARCTSALTTWAAAYSKGTNGVDYTRTGSGWPVKVALNFTVGTTDVAENGFEFQTGCTGDGNPNTIDLFLCIQGNGHTTGFGNDAVKVGASAHDVQVVSNPNVCGNNIEGRTGGINDGPKECDAALRAAGKCAHQDCIQVQGASNIQWFDSVMGDYHGNVATCTGSGGGYWINAVAPTSYCTGSPGCAWVRGHSITCNHGLNAKITTQNNVVNPGNSFGIVTDSVWRVGVIHYDSDGTIGCSVAAGSNNLATEAPSWTFSNNSTAIYCATGSFSYCVNHGGSGFDPTQDAW